MFEIVLFQPEIPPNTGNIIRLCANSGMRLHLIHPLGFIWKDKQLQRAGLDYHALSCVAHHKSWEAYLEAHPNTRCFAMTTKGSRCYAQASFEAGDSLVFGPETRGLPDSMLEQFAGPQRLRIPMQAGSRSLNLSNAVAIVSYEAWRQVGFATTATPA